MLFYGLLTLGFAYCSIVYQLFLAQALSATLGGTNLRYAMTIGLYISFMGLGALFAERLAGRGREPLRTLYWVELALVACGVLCVPYVLAVEWMRITLMGVFPAPSLSSHLLAFAAPALSHLPILVIGVLSGFELPLLMSCEAKRKETEGEDGSGFQTGILAWDYFGTCLGALAFPLYLLPILGLFGVSFLTSMLNCLFILILFWRNRAPHQRINWYPTLILTLVLASLLYSKDEIQDFVVHGIYLVDFSSSGGI